jgi:hypothetical protein
MKTWLTKITVGVLGIAIILAIPAGGWAMILSGGGEPVPPAFQLAGTFVRVMLALAVAATPGILFWLAVAAMVALARLLRRSAPWGTAQHRPRHGQGQFPVV